MTPSMLWVFHLKSVHKQFVAQTRHIKQYLVIARRYNIPSLPLLSESYSQSLWQVQCHCSLSGQLGQHTQNNTRFGINHPQCYFANILGLDMHCYKAMMGRIFKFNQLKLFSIAAFCWELCCHEFYDAKTGGLLQRNCSKTCCS